MSTLQPVTNPCPQHPNESMKKVVVLGKELWECAHPSHDTGGMSQLRLFVSPIRARAARHEDTWRDIPPPQYIPYPAPASRPLVKRLPVSGVRLVRRSPDEATPVDVSPAPRSEPPVTPERVVPAWVTAPMPEASPAPAQEPEADPENVWGEIENMSQGPWAWDTPTVEVCAIKKAS